MPVVILGLAGMVLLQFLAYLSFLAFVVLRTGQTSGLRDVAAAIKAYRGVFGIPTNTTRLPNRTAITQPPTAADLREQSESPS